MAITCRPAQCAQKEPGQNYHFDRPWSHELVTGPDLPTGSAYVWHADALAAQQEAAQRMKPAWRRAEAQWRAHVGNRAAGERA